MVQPVEIHVLYTVNKTSYDQQLSAGARLGNTRRLVSGVYLKLNGDELTTFYLIFYSFVINLVCVCVRINTVTFRFVYLLQELTKVFL